MSRWCSWLGVALKISPRWWCVLIGISDQSLLKKKKKSSVHWLWYVAVNKSNTGQNTRIYMYVWKRFDRHKLYNAASWPHYAPPQLCLYHSIPANNTPLEIHNPRGIFNSISAYQRSSAVFTISLIEQTLEKICCCRILLYYW